MTKKAIITAVAAMSLVSSVLGAEVSTKESTPICINGSKLTQTAATGKAYVSNNRVMIPTRVVSENLGFNVVWDNGTKKATITEGDNTVVLTLNTKVAAVNGKSVTLDTMPAVTDDRIYVPIRFVSEALGSTVDYKDKTVYITTGTGVGGTVTIPSTPSNDSSTATGFVGVTNMVAGKEYLMPQIATNMNVQGNALEYVATHVSKGDTSAIVVKKGNLGDSTSGITIKAFGWDSAQKIYGAVEYTGNTEKNIRVIYFKGNTILGIESSYDIHTANNKKYFMFGDGLGKTPSRFASATHIGIAVSGSGEVLLLNNPTTTPILGC